MATKKNIQRSKDPNDKMAGKRVTKESSKKVEKATLVKKQTLKSMDFSAPVFSFDGKQIGSMTLPKEIFNVEIRPALIAQVVQVYLANQRQGAAHTKTRGQVAGSGRKIYRQKGTGRARHGDRYAPIFVGGGIAHGPKHRDFSKKVTTTMKRKALCGVLTQKQKTGKVVIVDGLEKASGKTKEFFSFLKSIEIGMKRGKLAESILVATPGKTHSVMVAGRNIENVLIKEAQMLNTYEVLRHKKIIIAKEALPVLTKIFIKA